VPVPPGAPLSAGARSPHRPRSPPGALPRYHCCPSSPSPGA